ncbi:trigger factor [Thalassotalea sp. HSM 43]|uniref:trigger factor n=1 Tax=Thalassotalea sp. HSM 43 TaxID=2552945 RepID=UPI001081C18D|nr:trigger factor [Thalassotalea sp. HSM 43]QBY05199.1 trigger factor [Thalassotalea sp. HSM 43]
MQVSVETTQGLERKVSITVPAETVDVEVKNRLRQFAKTYKAPGFRPGKVPANVIQKRFGASVRQEVAGELMQRHFVEAIVAEKLNPAGRPAFVAKSNEEGKELAFEATFEIYPEVAISGLDKIKVEKPVVDVTDTDLEEMFKTLQNQHKTWKENKRKTKKGDKLTIDFLGRVDGEEFEGGKAEGFELELGSGRMIPGFEKEITGMKVGEEKTITVTFPEDYHAENLKGKDAEFEITVHKTEGPVLPEIDDEFAKLFGVEDGGVDALREEVKKNMERELSQAVKGKVKEQVLNGLVEANDLDLPKALVDQEVDVLRQQAMQRFGNQVDPNNMPQLPAEMFTEQAERRVKVGLLLGEVIKVNELKVDEDKVKALIETAASAYEDPQEVVDYYMNNQELNQQMQHVALEEQAVEFILANADVAEKETAFKDVMNPQA